MSTREQLIHLRHRLHALACISGQEANTRDALLDFFQPFNTCFRTIPVGNSGMALIFSGKEPGPTLLLRCELDAVPVAETLPLEYASITQGVSHKCGHDGHMAIMAGVGTALAEKPLSRGRVVVLFQPAEETGEGALAVVNDPAFSAIIPDYAFAFHNLPGYPQGSIIVREGIFTSASQGMSITLTGSSAHAAQPETGNSPARAMCQCIQQLPLLPQQQSLSSQTCLSTVVGARLGEKAFGTAPAVAEVFLTLRSETDAAMTQLTQATEEKIHNIATADNLTYHIEYSDIFTNTVNSVDAVEIIKRSVGEEQLIVSDKPFRWSEDFGRIAAASGSAAFFGIGAGEDCPDLHDQLYDFPDALLLPGRNVVLRIVETVLGYTMK
ncbi:amidohydrolase [Desulfogranum japonicum]|uniref:amidohydrolase n=1 Tax=Desulfogranum japonicum TaxID=231447 RepID=UPI000405CF27|nr:amidohydrolase [Desulfogranum japonicum]